MKRASDVHEKHLPRLLGRCLRCPHRLVALVERHAGPKKPAACDGVGLRFSSRSLSIPLPTTVGRFQSSCCRVGAKTIRVRDKEHIRVPLSANASSAAVCPPKRIAFASLNGARSAKVRDE